MRLSEVGKSEMLRGVFRPLTKIQVDLVNDPAAKSGFRRTYKRVLDEAYAGALRARLRGDPVFHGGDGRRIRRLTKGKTVDTTSGRGRFQRLGLLHTTTNKDTANVYAVAGRTPKTMRENSGAMNRRISPRANRGKVAVFNARGVFPKALAKDKDPGHLELLYDQKDLKGRLVAVDGANRGRSARNTRLGDQTMRLSEVSKGPHPRKYLVARAARSIPKPRPASELPRGKLYRIANGELVAVQRTVDGSLIMTRTGKRYTVARGA